MSFIKHVGKVGEKNVVIIFRKVPGEDHNALVVYNNNLNQNISESLMRVVHSRKAQESIDLFEAVSKSLTNDGRPLLSVLHAEGLLKKVQNNNIIVTPAPGQFIRLGELNTLLDEMAKGAEATKRLSEIDASHGLQKPSDVAKRMQGLSTIPDAEIVSADALDESGIANNLLAQAARMKRDAEQLLAEVARLTSEAAALMPVIEEPIELVLQPIEPVEKPKKTTRAKA